MKRPILLVAILIGAALPAVAQQASPAPSAPPHLLDLSDLRIKIAQGKLRDAAAMAAVIPGNYAKQRDALPPSDPQRPVDSCMVGYSLFAEAQTLALKGDLPGARQALQQGQDYLASHPETQDPRLGSVWQELATVTSGLLLEKQNKLADAVQIYLQASDSPIATGRLALVEWKLGRPDQAKTWAFIHPESPTAQLVLAQIEIKAKNAKAVGLHLDRAWSELSKEEKQAHELMPAYFCEAPGVAALRAKWEKKPAAKPDAPHPGA